MGNNTFAEATVVLGTSFPLVQPCQDARVTKSVTAARLMGISLAQ